MYTISFSNPIHTCQYLLLPSSPPLQFPDKLVSILPRIARSDLFAKRTESVTVGTVSSGPIYPCAVCPRVVDALILVRALDGGAVVVVV